MNTRSMYQVRFNDAKSIMIYLLKKVEGHSVSTIGLYKRAVSDLLSESKTSESYLNLDKQFLLKWMIADVKGKSIHYAAIRLQVVYRYIEFLCKFKLLPANPLREIKPGYRTHRWADVVIAMQSDQPVRKIRSLQPKKPQIGPLYGYIQKYIKLQRSIGKKYRWELTLLCLLDTLLKKHKIYAISKLKIDHIYEWAGSMQCNKKTLLIRISFLKRFLDYLISLGILKHNLAEVVIQELGRVPPSTFRPYIFTKGEIVKILKHAKDLKSNYRFKLRPQVCYTMLVLLYALGLRNSEVRNLRFCDVDMEHDVLSINRTKFYKSRLIPFGPAVKRCLEAYISVRSKMFLPIRPEDPLFITFRRQPISQPELCSILRLISKHLSPQPLQSPRIHDFRHTFAVHRLLKWYREGADVQSKLQLLSAFMGHKEIHSTEVYITMTMDLLKEANTRFYNYSGKEIHI